MLLVCHEHLLVFDFIASDTPYCTPNHHIFVEEGLFAFHDEDNETIKQTWYLH